MQVKRLFFYNNCAITGKVSFGRNIRSGYFYTNYLCMKTLFLVLLISVVQPLLAQDQSNTPPAVATTNSGILVVRVFEPHTIGLGQPMILLTYDGGKTEEILLKKVNKDNAAFNAEVLQRTLVRLKLEGFVIKAATGGDFYSTYILERIL